MKEDGLYIIEKIIKKVGNKYLIKWQGYNSSFISYVNENDIVKYIYKYDIIKTICVILYYKFINFYVIIISILCHFMIS